jgi:nucleoside-diphosphate-sugar epimerase
VGKLVVEKYLLYGRDAYGFSVTVIRPFNTSRRKRERHFVVEKIVVQRPRFNSNTSWIRM